MKNILFKMMVLLYIFTTANSIAQIPNSGFETWCIPPKTYNIIISNDWNAYKPYEDSLIFGSHTIIFHKFFTPDTGLIRITTIWIYNTPDSLISSYNQTITDFCSNKIFVTYYHQVGWDGKTGGYPAPSGIYKRNIFIKFTNGDTIRINDSLQLIRFNETCSNYVQPKGWCTNWLSVPLNDLCAVIRDTSHYPSSVGNYSIRLQNDVSSGYGASVVSSRNTYSYEYMGPVPIFPVDSTHPPKSLTGYYKFKSLNNDTMNIWLILFHKGDTISTSMFRTSISTPNWTSFNLPIKNSTHADSGLIAIFACNPKHQHPLTLFPRGNSVLNVDNLNFDKLITFDSLQGNLSYDNTINTPIKNTKLYLINSNNEIVDSTITDSTGHYIFTNVVNDSYTIQPVIPIPWGGANPIDALLINRSYIGLYNFTDALLKQAGDVNVDGKINPIDALLVNRRYINLINKFKVPDWLWETPTITVQDKNVIQNIKAVCAGDVNGSYKF